MAKLLEEQTSMFSFFFHSNIYRKDQLEERDNAIQVQNIEVLQQRPQAGVEIGYNSYLNCIVECNVRNRKKRHQKVHKQQKNQIFSSMKNKEEKKKKYLVNMTSGILEADDCFISSRRKMPSIAFSVVLTKAATDIQNYR